MLLNCAKTWTRNSQILIIAIKNLLVHQWEIHKFKNSDEKHACTSFCEKASSINLLTMNGSFGVNSTCKAQPIAYTV